MFEAKTITDHRIAVLESLLNEVIGRRLEQLNGPDPIPPMIRALSDGHHHKEAVMNVLRHYDANRNYEKEGLEHLMDRWSFLGLRQKDQEAKRIIGDIAIDPADVATREWMEPILRAQSGLLQCFGTGLHNPAKSLVGNSAGEYQEWLLNLEDINSAVSDTRISGWLRDSVMGQAEAFGGIPVLLINTGDFLHLMAITETINVQSLSIRHLPANWNWDLPGQWRTEVFSYLDNMTKEEFIRELAVAVKAAGQEFLYYPTGSDSLNLMHTYADANDLEVQTVVLVTEEEIKAKVYGLPNFLTHTFDDVPEAVRAQLAGVFSLNGVDYPTMPFPVDIEVNVFEAVDLADQPVHRVEVSAIAAVYYTNSVGVVVEIPVDIPFEHFDGELNSDGDLLRAYDEIHVDDLDAEITADYNTQTHGLLITSSNPNVIAVKVLGERVVGIDSGVAVTEIVAASAAETPDSDASAAE